MDNKEKNKFGCMNCDFIRYDGTDRNCPVYRCKVAQNRDTGNCVCHTKDRPDWCMCDRR